MFTLPDLPYSGATMPVPIFEMLLENTQATRYYKNKTVPISLKYRKEIKNQNYTDYL